MVHAFIHLLQEGVGAAAYKVGRAVGEGEAVRMCLGVELGDPLVYFRNETVQSVGGGGKLEHDEFVARKTEQPLVVGAGLPQNVGQRFERLVAFGMPEVVVDVLEPIDIQHNARKTAALADPRSKNMVQVLSVVRFYQRVDISKFVLLHHKQPDQPHGGGEPRQRQPVDQKLQPRSGDDGHEEHPKIDKRPRAVLLFVVLKYEENGNEVKNDDHVVCVAERSAFINVAGGDDVRNGDEIIDHVYQNHQSADDDVNFVLFPNSVQLAVQREVHVHQKEEGEKHICGKEVGVERVI